MMKTTTFFGVLTHCNLNFMMKTTVNRFPLFNYSIQGIKFYLISQNFRYLPLETKITFKVMEKIII